MHAQSRDFGSCLLYSIADANLVRNEGRHVMSWGCSAASSIPTLTLLPVVVSSESTMATRRGYG